MIIHQFRTGGQSGVDQAVLDTARTLHIPLCGWVPQGGWAENYPDPPGILATYPELRETPSPHVNQRTEWNVRDSHVTLILQLSDELSPGTRFTQRCADHYGRACITIDLQNDVSDNVMKVVTYLTTIGAELTVNVAGARESEAPGIYEKTCEFISQLIHTVGEQEHYPFTVQ